MIRVSDILRGSIERYLQSHKLSFKQRKVVNKLTNCFSENSTRVIFECSNKDCKNIELRKQPCRDRHCNRCNTNKKLKWLKRILEDYPPLPYYHVVFTLPSELHNLAICNQKQLYDIFFKTSFNVLSTFGKDPKYFGGKLGFIGLLHTWGQKLNYHPHIHYMVLSGGIKEGRYSKLPYQKDFIFPVKAMSKVLMGKFIELLRERYTEGKLRFPGKLESISGEQSFSNFLYRLSGKPWVVYSKKPLFHSERVLEYISRYTHKVAISNHRIKSYINGKVSFEYLDYKSKDPGKKVLTLTDMEFIRRFMLHILPDGYRKIRYGGIFSSNRKRGAVAQIRSTLKKEMEELLKRSAEQIRRIEEGLILVCEKCSGELLPQKIMSLSGFL